MGNSANFYIRRKSDNSEYVALTPAKTVNGVKGKLIKRRGDPDDHTNLPMFAKTSDVYFRQNKKGVCQARVYINQSVSIDFDWSHAHNNKGDKRNFPAGVIHVQIWVKQKDGSIKRLSNDARFMNNDEIKKYGPLIKKFCPTVKFRK